MKAERRRAGAKSSRVNPNSAFKHAAIALGALGFVAAAVASIYLQSERRFGAGEATPLAEGCITDKSGFRALAGKPEFYVELSNACSQRARCIVHVNVTGSHGSKTDTTTLTLPAGAPGQEIKATWATPTAENGGMANLSRRCVGI